ncbi:MAG: hypothetical protein ABI193_27145 [Minicystis sp.]
MSDEAPHENPSGNDVPVETTLLPEGVLKVRLGPGANCSSAGSAIDVLFYGSVIVGALAVALAAAFPPKPPPKDEGEGDNTVSEPHESPP